MEAFTDLSKQEQDEFISQLVTPESQRLSSARQLQEVDLNYGASPLCLDLDNTFLSGPKPGTRAPDAADLIFADRTTNFFSLPTDPNYRLLLFCGDPEGLKMKEIKQAAEGASRFEPWLKLYIVTMRTQAATFGEHAIIEDRRGNMHRTYAAGSLCIYLIRPDGYVAYRSANIGSVKKYFQHIDLTP